MSEIDDLIAEMNALAATIRQESVALSETIDARQEAAQLIESARADMLEIVLNERFAVNNKLVYTNDLARRAALVQLEEANAAHQAVIASYEALKETEAVQKANIEEKRNLFKLNLLALQYYIGQEAVGDVPPIVPPVAGQTINGGFGVYDTNHTVNGFTGDPFAAVQMVVTYSRPGGGTIAVGGFHYDTPSSLWKSRIAPDKAGVWNWSASTIVNGAAPVVTTGQITVGAQTSPGFVKAHPTNALAWVCADGTPFHLIGLGDCINPPGNNQTLAQYPWGFDGRDRPPAPEIGDNVDIDTYFQAYGNGCFDVFRWSVNNCAFDLKTALSPTELSFSIEKGIDGETLCTKVRANQMRLIMVMFQGIVGSNPVDTSTAARANVKKIVQYCLDRYGAYVDFWEIINEAESTLPNVTAFVNDIYAYIKANDPYGHPVSASFQYSSETFGELYQQDFNSDWTSPHLYFSPARGNEETEIMDFLSTALSYGKRTIVTEFGRLGFNWSTISDFQGRVNNWVAFFQQFSLVYWNSSFVKNYGDVNFPGRVANQYIGSELRAYIRVLATYVSGFPAGIAAPAVLNDSSFLGGARTMSTPTHYGAYLHAVDFTEIAGRTITINLQFAPASAAWIDPVNGTTKEVISGLVQGTQTINVPSFYEDIALKILAA